MSDAILTDRDTASAWGDLASFPVSARVRGQLGVNLDLIDDARVTAILVRAGQAGELAARVRQRFACDLPAPGKVAFARQACLVWSALGQWLVIGDADARHDDLLATLAGVASVVDQSDSRALVRLRGPRVRDALAKGVSVDLHPCAFATGSTAITRVAHVSVQLWQVDEAPTYVLAVPRSFAGSIRAWLGHACAGFGYDVARTPAKDALFADA